MPNAFGEFCGEIRKISKKPREGYKQSKHPMKAKSETATFIFNTLRGLRTDSLKS